MVASFLAAWLTPTTTVLARVYITTIQAEIERNTMVIPTSTSPVYDHLVLIDTPIIYTSYGAKNFPAPMNPGLYHMHINNAN